jgi:hypothetical protein
MIRSVSLALICVAACAVPAQADGLAEAARAGDAALVQKLLDEGVDPNAPTYGLSPLEQATARCGTTGLSSPLEIVEHLLAAHADPTGRPSGSAKDRRGRAVVYASKCRDAAVVSWRRGPARLKTMKRAIWHFSMPPNGATRPLSDRSLLRGHSKLRLDTLRLRWSTRRNSARTSSGSRFSLPARKRWKCWWKRGWT